MASAAAPQQELASWLTRRRKGQLFIVAGALLFSGANASLKWGNMVFGTSSWGMMMLRGALTVLINGCSVATQRGVPGLRCMVIGLPDHRSRGAHRPLVGARGTGDDDDDNDNDNDASLESPRPGSHRLAYLRASVALYGRGFIGCALSLSLVAAFTYLMTFGDAFALYVGMSTVMGMATAACALRERVSLALVAGAFLTIAGVCLVAKPAALFGGYGGGSGGRGGGSDDDTAAAAAIGGIGASGGLGAVDPAAESGGSGGSSGSSSSSGGGGGGAAPKGTDGGYHAPSWLGVISLFFSGTMSAFWYAATRALKALSPETLAHGYACTLAVAAGVGVLVNWKFLGMGTPAQQLPQTWDSWLLLLGCVSVVVGC
jgi:hypothetical protein